MPTIDSFTQLGIFARKNFLSEQECASFVEAMKKSSSYPSRVYSSQAKTDVVDQSMRRSQIYAVDPNIRSIVEQRLKDLIPELETHFQVKIEGVETEFTIYVEGDFFQPHIDEPDTSTGGPPRRRRQLAGTIFLNQEVPEPGTPGTFCGGNLTFFGLFPEEQWKNVGLSVNSEKGLLVLFPANLPHSVTTITSGERQVVTIGLWRIQS
jgi:predicted 2-oxoglutarate/Fe(II)-dependent dioxygenase YbiX